MFYPSFRIFWKFQEIYSLNIFNVKIIKNKKFPSKITYLKPYFHSYFTNCLIRIREIMKKFVNKHFKF